MANRYRVVAYYGVHKIKRTLWGERSKVEEYAKKAFCKADRISVEKA